MAGIIDEAHQQKHDGDLGQYADRRYQHDRRIRSKQRNGNGYR